MKVAQMEKEGLATLVAYLDQCGMIHLETGLAGRITEVCLFIFNVDGSMRKTAKSKLLELCNLEPVGITIYKCICLVDMGLIWRLATPTPEDCEAKE